MDLTLVDNEEGIQNERKPRGFGQRHVFAMLGFLGLANVYMMRVNLSVAIVDMVNAPSRPAQNISPGTCPLPNTTDNGIHKEGEFNWDGPTQGIVLGCFFWGYIITQIPAGILAEQYGGKLLFGCGIFFTAILTLAAPLAARLSTEFFIALRVLTGMAEGITLPAMHSMMARWIPSNERGTLGSFILAGMQFGTVIALPLSGLLCEIELDNGWPFVFYIFGLLGLVWYSLWHYCVTDGPGDHPRIGAEEKEYILSHVGHKRKTKTKTPWLSIFSCVHFWAIFVAHVGNNWGFYTLLTELPTYMKTVLHFDIKANGLLSAVPYLAMWVIANVTSWIGDHARKKRLATMTTVRKICNSVGSYIPAIALIGAAYSGCNTTLTIILLTLAVGANGSCYSGFQVNHIDLASNYAGILLGITNCFANICGFLAPYVVGFLVTNEGSVEQWRIVFFISAGIYFSANTFFVIFGSAEEQLWNRIPDTKSPSRPRSFGSVDSAPKEEPGTHSNATDGRPVEVWAVGLEESD